MTDKIRREIATKIKQSRKKMGLTQADIAKTVGITVNYYARLERGEVNPSTEVLVKIIKALGAEYTDILPS